ncbi:MULTISPECIES: hypothetical protein [unclassified Pseudomonas]|uniref:hypothetical protein n=1 Tax=unclassified Pseudomonas TaxID=196821 RepID=UPI00131B1995|nr:MULTISPECIES: hypothetical protein [unclassified Pseudomonas]
MDPMISALPLIAARLAALEAQVEELTRHQHRISSRTYSLENLQAQDVLSQASSDLKADALARHGRGALPKNIARAVGVTETIVRRWLKEAGLTPCNHSGSGVFRTCVGMDQSPDAGGAA